ncbi:unnamed protein product [Cuscuta campestris]|uniref:Uncharacterized protein n=1 Tax=Cuscuta campestris TaxID=132261 RepID=A0A484LYS0_9ASTE|nr:unnamed protein product [Cuscuta campestris]
MKKKFSNLGKLRMLSLKKEAQMITHPKNEKLIFLRQWIILAAAKMHWQWMLTSESFFNSGGNANFNSGISPINFVVVNVTFNYFYLTLFIKDK